MFNNFLKYSDSFIIGNSFFRVFTRLSLILAIASFFLIHRIDFAIISISYNLVFVWLYGKKIIRRTPGMLILMLHNFIYVQIPILFILSKDKMYNFGNFIIPPNGNDYYYNNLFFGILAFISFFLLMVFGLVIGGKITVKLPLRPLIVKKPQTIYFLIFLGVLIFYISIRDFSNYLTAIFNNEEKTESFIALLFNEKTYQLIFPILFYNVPRNAIRKSVFNFGIIMFTFLILDLLGGSKAALLQVFTSFFLTPLMIFYIYEKQIIWPRTKLFLIGGVLVIPLFIFTMISRELSNTGITVTLESFLNLVNSSYDFNIQIIIDLISHRLSALLNNFLLVFTEFSGVIDSSYRLDFIKYSFESFLNLILPGTPFPNSYVTTSQLFPLVLEKEILQSGLDKVTLLKQANTQPYSIFGFLMIIGGPVFTAFFSFIFALF